MNAVTEKPEAVAPAQSAGATPRRPFRTALRLAGGAGFVAGVVITGAWWVHEGRWIESTDNAYVQGDIAALGTHIEGDVGAIHVADNQVVKTGEPLISLDPADWQARLDQARGAAGEAAASVVTAQRQVEQAQAAIAQSDAMIAQADAELTRAAAEARRSASLMGSGWTSREANDQAVADERKATAQRAAAAAQRDSASRALAVAEAQVVQNQAHTVTAQAAVRLAERNVEETVIRAPFDGVAGNRIAQLGMHVIAGVQLISVTPTRDALYVVANFKETQLRRMQVGQPALLTPDIDSGAAVHGRVQSLAPATGALFSLLPPENATGNFTKIVQRVPVKIVIDPADAAHAGWLRAGLSVTAEVDTRGPDARRLGWFGAAAAALAP